MAVAKKTAKKTAKKKPAAPKRSAKKATKPAKKTAPVTVTAADLEVAPTAAERAGWTSTAASLDAAEVSSTLPIAVLTGESVDVAKFVRARWLSVLDAKTKAVVVPGLASAVRADQKLTAFAAVPTLHDGIAQEILTLGALVRETHTQALLSATSSGDGAHPRFESETLAADLRGAAESYLDDGVETDEDAQLRAVIDAHANDPGTDDALAGELDDYATFVETLLPGIDGYADFSATWIERARELSAALRVAPAAGTGAVRPPNPLVDLRNRLGTLLLRRMTLVRAKARFVFRKHPAVAREVTSAYERRRRAATRRAKKAAAKAPPKNG
jgi:hypothetical protein